MNYEVFSRLLFTGAKQSAAEKQEDIALWREKYLNRIVECIFFLVVMPVVQTNACQKMILSLF